jgi:hypothetical protein
MSLKRILVPGSSACLVACIGALWVAGCSSDTEPTAADLSDAATDTATDRGVDVALHDSTHDSRTDALPVDAVTEDTSFSQDAPADVVLPPDVVAEDTAVSNDGPADAVAETSEPDSTTDALADVASEEADAGSDAQPEAESDAGQDVAVTDSTIEDAAPDAEQDALADNLEEVAPDAQPDDAQADASGLLAGTVLMLHLDGADQSTTFTDSSPSAHVVTLSGGVAISVADSKFGGASAHFDGIDGFLSVDDTTDWNFGTGDFTVDFWMKSSGANGTRMQLLSFGDAGSGANLDFDLNDPDVTGTGLWVYWNSGGSNRVITSTSVTDGVWHHLALTRSGDTMRGFVDGGLFESTSYAGAIDVSGIGTRSIGQYHGNYFRYSGYIDELRMVKGTAVWVSDFTPPASAY